MKIERFFHGMINGKITEFKTGGVNALLRDKSIQRLRKLTEEDSDKYLWFPTEQTVAVPHVISVCDGDGREWVQNCTKLMAIHDYLCLTDPVKVLSCFPNPSFNEIPEVFEPLEVNP